MITNNTIFVPSLPRIPEYDSKHVFDDENIKDNYNEDHKYSNNNNENSNSNNKLLMTQFFS